jgi:type VI secretion system protein ImpL
VTRWLQALAISGNQLRGGGALDQAKKAFGAPGGPASLCSKAVTGRYPFTPGSTNDIPLDDFARLFATGGLLDKFFNDNLQTFVDTSARPGRHSGGKRRAARYRPTSRSSARIADPRPVLRWRRQSADRAFRHRADGYRRQADDARVGRPSVVYEGRSAPSVTWPGRTASPARAGVRSAAIKRPAGVQATGPWALFRLIALGTLRQAMP